MNEPMSKYKSSVMNVCDESDTECVMCRFIIHDDRSPSVLMHVIETLDHHLAETEKAERMLTRELIKEKGL